MDVEDHRILVVDDEEDVRAFCLDALRDGGFSASEAGSGREALRVLERGDTDILLTDLMMPEMGGVELLKAVKRAHPGVDVVIMTGYGTVATAVEALQAGAYDYITKPLALEDLISLFARLTEKRRLASDNAALREQLRRQQGLGGLIGASAKMQQVYRLILKVAGRRNPVLVLGETGTGKELVARAIHSESPRGNEPFVPVDCGALSESLIESELFGYVRGAFTDARQDRRGLLAAAGSGTLFLDEIGELPPAVQSTFLRALQEREFRPLGSTRFVPLEARIVAATNRDLEAEVKAGRFREDLYYRLNVFVVSLPPLRERRTDIPALAEVFLGRHCGPDDPIEGISTEAVKLLMDYDWPGNVRELENYIQRAIAVSAGPLIGPEDLPARLSAREQVPGNHDPGPAAAPQGCGSGLTYLQEMERKAIVDMLAATGGHRVRAAKRLGMSKTGIYRKLKEYGLDDGGGQE